MRSFIEKMHLIIDAHQDLAWNMLTFGRDYTLPAAETRRREHGTQVPIHNGDTLLGWEDYQRGNVAVVFGTLFATPVHRWKEVWDRLVYRNSEEAHRLYWQQAEQYRRFTDSSRGKFHLVENRRHLEQVLAAWQAPQDPTAQPVRPVGLVILMEGAEGVRTPAELESWFEAGIRIIGPAWAGTRFCGGTHEPGGLTGAGIELLEAMQQYGLVLDVSHMDEKAALQALDRYQGRIIASHANCAALLHREGSNRNLSDEVIVRLAERKGIIGVVPMNPFLDATVPSTQRQAVPLRRVVEQIDHICQLTGSVHHAALGTDFDGGFGLQQAPAEIDTIADLQKLAPLLKEAGYTDENIAAVLGGNWAELLREELPEG